MNKNNILISVIIPTYNSANYISESINSILSQSFNNVEIIIVDDGSTDDTKQIVSKTDKRIYYYSQEHKGISAALNKAVKLSNSSFLSFLDADDLWYPNKLELQLSFLLNNQDIDMVFGHVVHFISPELSREEMDHVKCPQNAMPGYSRSAMLIRKESYLQAGSFSEKYSVGEFIEWYSRAQEIGLKSYLLSDLVLKRRIHKQNTTMNNNRLGSDYAKLLKVAIDRKRKKL